LNDGGYDDDDNHTEKQFGSHLLLMAALGSYLAGKADSTRVPAENERVTAAIARTMRCQTEVEYAAGTDHQCTASEIRQDAGLEVR